MFGLGLSLTLGDFARVAKQPKAVIIALVCQLIVLPAICFGLVLRVPAAARARRRHDDARRLARRHHREPLQPPVPRRHRTEHLADGRQLGDRGGHAAAHHQLRDLVLRARSTTSSACSGSRPLEVFAIVLLPVALGMIVRRFWPRFAEAHGQAGAHRVGHHPGRRDRRCGRIQLGAPASTTSPRLALITIVFCVISLGIGYFVPRCSRSASVRRSRRRSRSASTMRPSRS